MTDLEYLKHITLVPGKRFVSFPSSDMISSLDDCKMDVKSFVFIKTPRIEKVINARQHFLSVLSSVFKHFLLFDIS